MLKYLCEEEKRYWGLAVGSSETSKKLVGIAKGISQV